jgi:hypothetical protein
MSFKNLKIGLIFTLALGLAGVGPVLAEETGRAAIEGEMTFVQGADGYRTATRLGGSRAFFGPVRDVKALTKMAANKTVQKNISTVMDQQGLTSLTARVLEVLAAGNVQETTFPIGGTMEWMSLKTKGKPDALQKVRWGGKQAFEGFAFSIEDGAKIYNFIVPEACGNLALVNVTDKPLPECVRIAVDRDCNTKTLAIRATGASIDNKKITKVEVSRNGAKLGDLMGAQGFKWSGPVAGGRYGFKATDEFGRDVPICDGRREVSVEECPVPKPVVEEKPPAPASCGVVATAMIWKGGWRVTIDGSGSATGASPAKAMTFEIVGPTGAPVPMMFDNKTENSITVGPPFSAQVLVRKPLPGTYTLRAKTVADNAKAAGNACETTFVVGRQESTRNFFMGGYFGKERRQRDTDISVGFPPQTIEVTEGYCAPLLGLKAGMGFRVSPKFEIAPAAGFALNFDEGDQSSLFVESEFNYLFSNGGYAGLGIGWWDFNHGDTDTGSILYHFGVPVWASTTGNRVYLAGELRTFFEGFDEVGSNYQFWAGLRFKFGAQ